MKRGVFVYNHSAFILLGFFIIGFYFAKYSFYPTIMTTTIVIIYSSILFWVQGHHKLSLSQNVQDSPYILGFLFTLVSIYFSFSYLSTLHDKDVSKLLELLFSSFGVALFTTITGLIGRHFLLTYDPELKQKQEHFDDIINIMKNASHEFTKSHKNLLDLIDEFKDTHSNLLDEEQSVGIKHIKILSEAIEKLNTLEVKFPQHIENLIKSIESLSNKLNDFSDNAIENTSKELTNKISDFINSINNKLSMIKIEDIKNLNQTTIESIKNLNQSTIESIKKINEEVSQILVSFEKGLTSFIPVNKKVVSNVEQLNKTLETEVKTVLTTLNKHKKDIDKIDSIFNKVINVLENRLEQYEK